MTYRRFWAAWSIALMSMAVSAGAADSGSTETAKASHRVDDGEPETGYGFVPSSKWGEVVQRFDVGERSVRIDELCVCWLKKRGEETVDFQVRGYAEAIGRPAAKPLWFRKASARVEARSREEMGAVDCVDVGDVWVEGTVFLGVRWDPGEEAYAFVCADHSESTSLVSTYYRDDRMKGWVAADQSPDPNFRGHRALVLWPETTVAPKPLAGEASAAPRISTSAPD